MAGCGVTWCSPVSLLTLGALVILSCRSHPSSNCRHRAPGPEEVIYKVHQRTNHVLKRQTDQHLRVKTEHDASIDDLVPAKRRLVKNKLFPQAISYLQKTFQVRKPSSSILLSRQCANNQYLRRKSDVHRYCHRACAQHTRCGPVIVPEEHLQQCMLCSDTEKYCGPSGPPDSGGVRDADFVLYVSAITTERCSQENIVAYAAYCQLEAEMDRPIAGYANLCPNMISTQPQEFAGMLSTVEHEIIHALGFSAGLFALYYDDNGEPLTPRYMNGLPIFNESLGVYQWSDRVVRTVTRSWDVRGPRMVQHNVFLLVTPRVTAEVQKHFNCPILEGMELENQGGMGTELNHWEKRLLENEAMTGSHTQNRVFSRITLALMEDTGWKNLENYLQLLSPTVTPVGCSPDGLHIWVEEYPYLCTRAGQVLTVSTQINGWFYEGNLICPPCSDFCDFCPPEREPPVDNRTRSTPLDVCSRSSNLVVTLWLLMLNLLPLLAGFFLCVYK
ncbi:leishmanolysin-like peptidase [Pseudophryne corroboree]|uniref:leishmanolysin-like peptidase n=1 Tax=Pseudophryne corroboree TaxID=495146 RepID=UPI00308205D9